MRPRTDTQTHRQTDPQTRVTTIHFASSTTHAKCNKPMTMTMMMTPVARAVSEYHTYTVGGRRGGAAVGGSSSRCSVCGRQRQCRSAGRRRRQLGPDVAQLAVEAVLVRRQPPAPGRRRASTVDAEACSRAGRRRRRRRDDAPVRAEVGGRARSRRSRQQSRVGNVDDVAMRHRVTLHLQRQTHASLSFGVKFTLRQWRRQDPVRGDKKLQENQAILADISRSRYVDVATNPCTDCKSAQ